MTAGRLQNCGCNAIRESKWITIMKKIVPHVLCNLGGYLFEWLDGSSNLSESYITFSAGTGFFNLAVSWKITDFIILEKLFSKRPICNIIILYYW